MTKIDLEMLSIGKNFPCFVIAEAGINHEGEVDLGKKLVKSAVKAGANAIKFQIYRTEEFINKDSDYFNLFKELELSEDDWFDIADYSNNKGILFMGSVFGKYSADLLEKLNSPLFKLASGDLNHKPLIRYVSQKNMPIIISTGMSTLCEISEAVNVVINSKNRNLALMHCISNYPTNYEDTNLNFITTLKQIFDVPVGFSDHTDGIITPVIATTLGADIIEKHFTLNKDLPGPDHRFSLEPKEFKSMIENIRITESALGTPMKNLTKEEKNLRKLARRSITAAKNIQQDEKFMENNINFLRPGKGIEPKFTDLILGKHAKQNIKKDHTIRWDDVFCNEK